jgi:Uma2 family endonuclease
MYVSRHIDRRDRRVEPRLRSHREGGLSARAAVPDYWIVNPVDGVVEVYRDPATHASAAFGWRYRSVARLAPPATIAPLAFSGERIAVADLLPQG